MTRSKNLKRCYLLLGIGWLLALVYFVVVTLPLVRQERALDEKLLAASERLAAAGHGMNSQEVLENIEHIERDIRAFSEIGQDEDRRIRFGSDVEKLLASPFQLLDFDYHKFLMIDGIRVLSAEKGVRLFSGWEQRLPLPGPERPHLLWAQLTVMDQLLRTVIGAGVTTVDELRLIPEPTDPASPGGGTRRDESEVSVQMRLTGNMKAIQSVLMMLPLNGEELDALGLVGALEVKSSFFPSRFILKKSSTENADEVSLEFVARGFLGAAATP